MAGCEPGSRVSQKAKNKQTNGKKKNRLAGALILDFPTSKTVIECLSVVYSIPNKDKIEFKMPLKCDELCRLENMEHKTQSESVMCSRRPVLPSFSRLGCT